MRKNIGYLKKLKQLYFKLIGKVVLKRMVWEIPPNQKLPLRVVS